jgi:hypothetical protein
VPPFLGAAISPLLVVMIFRAQLVGWKFQENNIGK